jgi:hypothetical protein
MAKKTKEIGLKAPIVPDGEVTRYHLRTKETGQSLGYITQVVNKILEEGEEYYKVNVKTESEEGSVLEESMIFKIAESLKPASYYLKVKNKRGEEVVDARMMCDQLEPPCARPVAASFCLRGAPSMLKKKVNFHLITSEGRFFDIDGAASSKKERVKVPAGDFQCYKMEMTPDMGAYMEDLPIKVPMPPGFRVLARQFTVSVCYWLSVEEPHYLVKYEGFLMDSLIGAQVIEELISIS